MWTFCFALDIYLQLNRIYVPSRSYHMLCWGFVGILTGLRAVMEHVNTGSYCTLPVQQASAQYLVFYVPIAVVMIALPVLFGLSLPKLRER
eukprot:m.180298 g.180298  ORF g.180298 m.180298 type:complete len:91 (+) comp39243_c0_seq16:179-451(+)